VEGGEQRELTYAAKGKVLQLEVDLSKNRNIGNLSVSPVRKRERSSEKREDVESWNLAWLIRVLDYSRVVVWGHRASSTRAARRSARRTYVFECIQTRAGYVYIYILTCPLLCY
jgi:hypothetical protein